MSLGGGLGRTAHTLFDYEGWDVYPFHALEDEKGDVVFGNPVAKVGRKNEKLFVIRFDEGGLGEFRAEGEGSALPGREEKAKIERLSPKGS